MGSFDSFFAVGDPTQAAADQTTHLNQGYNQLSTLFNAGRDAVNTSYSAGLSPLQSNYSVQAGGQGAYADATGANGADGYARALQQFHASPGYQFQLQQGNENILRNQARTGDLNSGATNLDLLNYGQGVANQEWTKYLDALRPFIGASTATGGQIAQTDASKAAALNSNLTTQGNAAYGTQAAIGNADANADLANGPFWGLLGGGINALAKVAGGKIG